MLITDSSRWNWKGTFRVKIFEHDAMCPEVLALGPCRCHPHIEHDAVDNLIVTAGKNLMRDGVRSFVSDVGIHYCALGTGGGGPAAGDTQLVAEGFRKALSTATTGSPGQSVVTCYIAPAEGNIAILEVGWFGGVSATATPNSGVLIARLLWTHTKTNLESLQCEHDDQF